MGMDSSNGNPWLRSQPPNPNVRLRLFCFPYAGGAASIFRTWQQNLPAEIEVCAVQLPGRENRFREQPITHVTDLVQALIPHLLPHLDKPFALFGHSMGALIAYALAHELQKMDQSPTHLLISGRRAPMLPSPDGLLHTLPTDGAFLAELQRRYNNLPSVVFDNPELRELFLPLLRADFTLVETYPTTQRPPLPCPVICFGGTDDPQATVADLRAWQPLTQADFGLHLFPGAHFYLNEQAQALLRTIAGYL